MWWCCCGDCGVSGDGGGDCVVERGVRGVGGGVRVGDARRKMMCGFVVSVDVW